MLIDQLGRAAEGAAADKDLSTGMLKDLRSKAKYLSRAAARDCRQLSKARVIDSKEVVLLRDERGRVDSEKAARAAAREEKKKQGTAEKLAARTKSKGKGIAVINLDEELEEFYLSEGDGYETMDAEVGDTSGLEGEEDSFVDIDDIPGTRSDQEGGIRGTSMMARGVEVVTRSGRRAGRVVNGK